MRARATYPRHDRELRFTGFAMLTRAYYCLVLAVSCGALKLVGTSVADLELVISGVMATSIGLSGAFLIAGLRRSP